MATRTRQPKPAEHPMQAIANGGAVAITKAPEQPAQDAKAWSKDFTYRVFSLADQQRISWLALAQEVDQHPIDHRSTMLDDLKAMQEKRRAAVALMSDDAPTLKAEKAKLASASVRISQLTGITKAFNAGGSIKACAETLGKDVKAVTFDDLYHYAKGIKGSEARRPADPFKVALTKFLESRADKLATDVDKVNHQRAMTFLDTLQ